MQECTGVGCLLHRCQGDQGVVFVSGTNCSFWLLAWMCNWKSLGSCCSVMPPQNGTEDPGELCDPVLKWCCHSEHLKTLLWQSSQRLVQLAQHRDGSPSVCLLKDSFPQIFSGDLPPFNRLFSKLVQTQAVSVLGEQFDRSFFPSPIS